MVQTLIQELHTNKPNDKIQKPNFKTRTGREFLAFYLSTKLKQVVSYDKKNESPLILNTRSNFLSIFLKNLINAPHNSIVIGIFGDNEGKFCKKVSSNALELELPIIIAESFSALLDVESKIVIVKCDDNIDDEYKKIVDEKLDIKIYIKKKKEHLKDVHLSHDIIVDGECSKEYLLEVLNYIKIITNDFSPTPQGF